MTNETGIDPQITEFVTKVMDMSPEAPMFPETVVAVAPPVRRRLAPWMWAPLAAAAAVLVIAPIAIRGAGDGDEFAGVPAGASQTVAEDDTSGASTDPIIGEDPVVPEVDQARNTLSLDPTVVAPGGTLTVDFSGEENAAIRSDLFWMDRFDYLENQWFAEWIMWSDRSAGGARSAPTASTSVIVPPLDITEEGDDRFLIPIGIPLGTYRLCIGTTDGACGVFEISDEVLSGSPDRPFDGPVEPIDEITVDPAFGLVTPSFGHVALDPSNLSVVVTPAQWLIGPDAELVARSDGFIGPDEDLPNGFYLRITPDVSPVEIELSPDFTASVASSEDPSIHIVISRDEWIEWMATQIWSGEPIAAGFGGPFMHLTYDQDGLILTVTDQYIP